MNTIDEQRKRLDELAKMQRILNTLIERNEKLALADYVTKNIDIIQDALSHNKAVIEMDIRYRKEQ